MLQVARFLTKSLTDMAKGKSLAPSVQYLQELKKENLTLIVTQDNVGCPHFINNILRNLACVAVKNMTLKLEEGVKNGLTQKQSWDSYASISLTEGSVAHAIYIIHKFYLDFISKIAEPKLKAVMTKLCTLYGLERIVERASQVYSAGIIAPEAFKLISSKR